MRRCRVPSGDRNCDAVIDKDAGFCECTGGWTTHRWEAAAACQLRRAVAEYVIAETAMTPKALASSCCHHRVNALLVNDPLSGALPGRRAGITAPTPVPRRAAG